MYIVVRGKGFLFHQGVVRSKLCFGLKGEHLRITLTAKRRVEAQFFLTQILMGSQGVYQALVSLD